MIAGNLYIWDGSSWQNMGRIKGDDGSSSFLHLKYSNDGGITFTAGNGETPGRYMGVLVDQNNADSNNPGDYKWNDTQGVDGTPGEPGKDGQTSDHPAISGSNIPCNDYCSGRGVISCTAPNVIQK